MEVLLLTLGAGAVYWYFKLRTKGGESVTESLEKGNEEFRDRGDSIASVSEAVVVESSGKPTDADFVREELSKISTKISELSENSLEELFSEFQDLPLNEGVRHSHICNCAETPSVVSHSAENESRNRYT